MYARPDAIRRGSGDYALNITRRLIEFYEDYFKVPYSLPKLGKISPRTWSSVGAWDTVSFFKGNLRLEFTRFQGKECLG